ncbi:5-formyltetrahydrofolate cyclo-ligase [Anaerofustis stercorihominis]|uniref:5-formyltetrahydrofolate cyclo-ligase n=1 Tax=Anaerofustis stercorihominis TaxID=214853 RepID=UPI00214B33F3|nr:5-formyltetrahydrofolate cyclo-ligase [Anaerofustis stercorihominis]MCR2033320.1 5-formyltetrahydrofolate cyclo-ligase [Anaerofustis stercorihominis]
MDKVTLRNKILKILNNIDTDAKNNKNIEIYNKLISNEDIINAENIMCFVSFKDEVDTHKFIKYLIKNNKNVYIPIIDNKNKAMHISKLNSFDELETGFYNILEPKKEYVRICNPEILDVIITPGVVFDKDNYRVGYGGGYYDKFFSNKNLDAKKIGLCYKEQITPKVPREDFDIPVDYIISD